MHLPNNTLLQGGKYKITRFIASGGFGCTYEAEHVLLGKRVAIKEFFVKDFCNRDEITSHVTVGTQSKVALVSKLKKKFIEEASALSRFNHPNIVHVSDVFEENGTAYYVMDFIDGKSIHEILKTQSTIPEAKAVKYITQVAEALKQVHAQNRLHLDIKPGNIIIDSNDNAILIDFGASKQYDEVDGENTSTLVGRTPGYAPLEQLGNDIVKFMPATDIYALGATLYKMLSGKTPLSATLLASGESLEPLPSNISKGTADAVMSCMETNKNRRPQSIESLLSLLSRKASYITEQDLTLQDTEDTIIESGNNNDLNSGDEQTLDKVKFSGGFKLALFAVCTVTILLIGFWTNVGFVAIDRHNNNILENNLSGWIDGITCAQTLIPFFPLFIMAIYTLFKRKLDAIFLCKLIFVTTPVYVTANAGLSSCYFPDDIPVILSSLAITIIWNVLWLTYLCVSKRIATIIPSYSRRLYIRDYVIIAAFAVVFGVQFYTYFAYV